MKNYREQAHIFLSQIINELKNYQYHIPSHSIDHLCYRTSSLENYSHVKSFLESQGSLLIEGIIGGRPIATYKIIEPIIFEDQSIDVIEVPSPKAGSDYSQGFEHFEIVINETFEDFIGLHPQFNFNTKAANKESNPDIKIQLNAGSIKFHHKTLEEVIVSELHQT